MPTKKETDDLFKSFIGGRLPRRDFIRAALAFGASATALGSVLEACGGETAEAPKPPPPSGPTPDAGPAPEPDLGPMETELNIYNWSDYIAEDTVANFEKETGVKVKYDTYESNEELLAKLQVGGSGYDIVVPTGYILSVLSAQNLLEPLVKKHLPNWKNVAPLFVNPTFDPGNTFGVPWQWGTTGIAYRSDKIVPAPDGWSLFLDAKYKNKMTMLNDQRDVIGAFLKLRGKSLSSADPADLAAAKADAIAAKANLKAFISAEVKGQVVSGDVWAAQLWNGDTAQASKEEPNIKYCLPKEGAAFWTDSLVIPKGAPHKRAAHAFMDFILRPEVATSISDFTGYGTPNAEAVSKLAVAVPYPTEDEMKRLEIQRDLGAASQAWDQLWTEIGAA